MLIMLFNEKHLLVQVKNYFLNPVCLKTTTTKTAYVITAKSDRRQEIKLMAELINL